MMRTRIWTRLLLGTALLLAIGCGKQDLYEFPDSPYPKLGQIDLPSSNEGVAVLGDYAFVAGGEAGLHVIDISDPANPVLEVTLNTTKYAESIDVVRLFQNGEIVDIAHIVEGTEGVTSYDVTDPLNPVDLLQGTTAVDGNRMAIVQPSDPTEPYLLFLAENWKGVRVFTSNAFVPGVLEYGGVFSSTLGYAKGLAYKDKWLYVADNEMGLVVMDASTLILGAFGVTNSVDTPGNALDVYVDGEYAYVADGTLGLHVFDISIPDMPVLTGSIDLPAYSRSIVVRDGLAFIAAATGGVHIIDVTDPTNPEYAGNVPSGYASDLAVTEDGLVLVADYDDGMYVLSGSAFMDITAPSPIQGITGEPSNFTTMQVNWFASGDDGMHGFADNYDVRWADAPIVSEGDWAAANQVSGTPQPGAPGSLETMNVDGFTPGQIAFFSVRVWDESGHFSDLPQSASVNTYTGTVLKDATVAPRVGSIEDPFVFSVTYLDEDSREPSAQANLVLDGETYPMTLSSGDFYAGAVYEKQFELEEGEHNFYFVFQPDGGDVIQTDLDEDLFAHLPIIFDMGSPLEELGRDVDEELTVVTLNGAVQIEPYEVTQSEWTAMGLTNNSDYQGGSLPVHNVDWYQALEYCNLRSAADGLDAAYEINGHSATWNRDADGWRLPSEAEWEWFARGGTTTAFCGGDITETGFELDPVLDIFGWYGGNVDPMQPQAVGGKAANDFGLYDMHGNVAEWCWDWYEAYAPGPLLDPIGPDSGEFKVIRGGDWFYKAKACRSASRETFPPTSGDNRVGFRVMRTLIEE